MIELCLSAPYSNEIAERFFSFMKIATGDWCSKLKEDNIEALLSIKVEDPGIEGFIKKHTSDAAVFW